MTSPARALAILDLFGEDHPVWHPDDINEMLGYTRATGYRYVRDLVESGFLAKVGAGLYALGPRIIELDHVLRHTDPMLAAAIPAMARLTAEYDAPAVLTSVYGSRLIDIHRTATERLPDLSYGRGRLRPFAVGAAPKVVLSWVPPKELKRLYSENAEAMRAAGLGTTLDEVSAALRAIRARDHYVSVGELEAEISAVAVAVRGPDGTRSHALALVGASEEFPITDIDAAVVALHQCRAEIEAALSPDEAE
ncbi:MAG: IclR family transcriptional regulator C-terminal domain-containing protein [Dermatophilus congolensis]|nr:IclR family transcriptional regulator C-terminal domain-containing protein [Dermatophilus congolensis]